MTRILSKLQNLLLSQIIIIFLVGIAFFGLQSFNYGSTMLSAQADTIRTPEGVYYKGTPDNEGALRSNDQVENARKSLKETGDNIREKLNLDENTPEATKDFLESVKNKVGETVEPITGNKRGYYQEKDTTHYTTSK
ncbi:hypothetical protein [Fortiea contorta]|uniref:hypothetical protein n=1 Tax=Fortiea contorta TaxID=1892405 RepID=UPI00035DD7EA|nr:hypothetical protein [Fortiea contorta]